MKMPRKIKTYCKYCKKHTEHEVHRTKKKKASEMAQGQRRFRRVMRGYRGFPRPKPEGREKTSRRINVKLTCGICKKSIQPPSQRSKSFSIE
ncbi:50S ribosomal protein L44e [Thermoplasmatales archaeon ex4572_165]|nr:MAG: 50S ribosomal protein L44e [Thermoplasmatales archaeon ex4572_165]RLF59596.1 MAG: 50S ribosomal protein L44e [Thermoplasmata archaeon]